MYHDCNAVFTRNMVSTSAGTYVFREHALSTQAVPSFEGNAREVERGGDEAKGKNHLLFPPLKTGGCHKGCPKAVKTSHSLLCSPSGGSM